MLKKPLALMALIFSLPANAAIVDNGTYTTDTSTGLDWLDVTATAGMSLSTINNNISVGGALEGWRYANGLEFNQLMDSFGFNSVCTRSTNPNYYCSSSNTPDDHVLFEEAINMLGDTEAQSRLQNSNDSMMVSPLGAGSTAGFIKHHLFPDSSRYKAIIYDSELVYKSNGQPAADWSDRIETYSYVSNPVATSYTGAFLVRTSPVPVPAAAWLFGSALIGLAGIKRKK